MSTVVDAIEDRKDGEEGENGRYDAFQGGCIEVDERELRLVSAPAVYAGRVKGWLDETAERLVYGQ